MNTCIKERLSKRELERQLDSGYYERYMLSEKPLTPAIEDVIEYQELMKKRNIEEYIVKEYSKMTKKNICLLCSEDKAENCHRLLVAKLFQKQFGCAIIDL